MEAAQELQHQQTQLQSYCKPQAHMPAHSTHQQQLLLLLPSATFCCQLQPAGALRALLLTR